MFRNHYIQSSIASRHIGYTLWTSLGARIPRKRMFCLLANTFPISNKTLKRKYSSSATREENTNPFYYVEEAFHKKQAFAIENDMQLYDPSLLCSDQKQVVDIMMQGHNLYFTGKAGTGKSLVIKTFIQAMKKTRKKIAVVAPTGISASLIGGQTLHSFASFPIMESINKNNIEKLIKRIESSPWRLRAYTHTQALVLDEASMIHPDLFDVFNYLMKYFRPQSSHLPFGGLQMIICGDFFQLPPVIKSRRTEMDFIKTPLSNENDASSIKRQSPSLALKKHSGYYSFAGQVSKPFQKNMTQIPYLFDSAAWKELMDSGMKTHELTSVFRQSDPQFIQILDELRVGKCSMETWEYLDSFRNKTWPKDGILPTQISAYRAVVDKRNQAELGNLKTSQTTFEAIDYVSCSDGLGISESGLIHPSPPSLMFTNFEFNSFQPERLLHLKLYAQVILIRNLSIRQKLVNGSKGVIIDFVKDVYDPVLRRHLTLPVVQFSDGSKHVIGFTDFEMPFKSENNILVRRQIPLKLGWALTVHRSQGMTMDRIDIDMADAFCPGHAYVAMSRIRELQGLNLKAFGRKSLILNQKVVDFYQKL